jgi:hypothetical protein
MSLLDKKLRPGRSQCDSRSALVSLTDAFEGGATRHGSRRFLSCSIYKRPAASRPDSSRPAPGHWGAVEIRRCALRVRRLIEAQHIVHREIEPDDSSGNCAAHETLGMSCAITGTSRAADRAASLPLQLRAPPPSSEVRNRDANAGNVGRIGDTTAFLPRRFLFFYCSVSHHDPQLESSPVATSSALWPRSNT